MTMKNKTRRALVLSVLSLILCCSMLVGTTFAWFSDSVSTATNHIQSGNLDLVVYRDTNYGDFETNYEKLTANTAIFKNVDGNDILWEPGATGAEQIKIANEGTLALKYKLTINAVNATDTPEGKTLADVLVFESAWLNHFDGKNNDTANYGEDLGTYSTGEYVLTGVLLPGEYDEFVLGAGWVPTVNDNDYNVEGGLKIDLGVNIVATQYTYEKDIFNDQYDKDAVLPIITPIVPEEGEVYEGEVIPNGMPNVAAWNGDNLQGDASIILKNTYNTVILENVTANLNGDAIITYVDNTIVLYNCDFILPEGAKLIKGENGAQPGQVMMCNVTVNGTLLEGYRSNAYINSLIDGNCFVEAIVE